MRMDLVLDMTGKPGQTFQVIDSFYRNLAYRLVDLAYASEPLRERPLDNPIALSANTMPEPDMPSAERHEVVFNGGMMGQMMMRDPGRMDGRNMMEMMRSGKIWFVNGKALVGHVMEPMLTLKRGRSCVLAMNNETAWHHPMHLHGHSFRVVSRNGVPTQYREWQDTVLMAPRERVEIAFVADNPGDWMFHCHILEHQESGMMGVIRVAWTNAAPAILIAASRPDAPNGYSPASTWRSTTNSGCLAELLGRLRPMKAMISPTMPRRNRSTVTTKIVP